MMRIAAVFVGWLMGLWSPIASSSLTRRLCGPKLYCEILPEEIPTNVQGVRQLFVSVRVGNSKTRIARDCRGYITKIEEMAGSLPTKVICEKTLQCIWEFDDQRDGFHIPQGAKPAFNVVMIEDQKAGFVPRIRRSDGSFAEAMEAYLLLGHISISSLITVDLSSRGFALRTNSSHFAFPSISSGAANGPQL